MLNKSEIMKEAWASYRKFNKPGAFDARSFGYELRIAWHKAKMAMHRAAMSAADTIRSAISLLENKCHWTRQDYQQHDNLWAELRAAA